MTRDITALKVKEEEHARLLQPSAPAHAPHMDKQASHAHTVIAPPTRIASVRVPDSGEAVASTSSVEV